MNFIGECVWDFQLISVMSGTVDVLTFLGEWISCWRKGGSELQSPQGTIEYSRSVAIRLIACHGG